MAMAGAITFPSDGDIETASNMLSLAEGSEVKKGRKTFNMLMEGGSVSMFYSGLKLRVQIKSNSLNSFMSMHSKVSRHVPIRDEWLVDFLNFFYRKRSFAKPGCTL